VGASLCVYACLRVRCALFVVRACVYVREGASPCVRVSGYVTSCAGSQRDSQRARAPKQTRPSCFRRTLRKIRPRPCHLCAGGLAAPLPHQSAPGRCFERHLSARVRTGVPYLSTARRSSVVTDTTGTEASGPSFTTTSTYIAATTAPPPSSMSTLTGVRRYSSKCPSKRSERSIVVIVVACDNSPPMCVRPTDELANGTPAANTLRILLSNSPMQHLSLLPRLDSCRVISSDSPVTHGMHSGIHSTAGSNEGVPAPRTPIVQPPLHDGRRSEPDAAPRCASVRLPFVSSLIPCIALPAACCRFRVCYRFGVCAVLRTGCRVQRFANAAGCPPYAAHRIRNAAVPCVCCCISHVLAASCMLFGV
jgi:hypothetical protein